MGFDVKNTTKISVLDLLCPHSCRGCGRLGAILCECCKNYIINVVKKTEFGQVPGLDFYLTPREGILFEMVKEYKYGAARGMAEALAEVFSEVMAEGMIEEMVGELAGAITGEVDEVIGEVDEIFGGASGLVICPLPTISRHIRERGFDHMGLFARCLAREIRGRRGGALGRKNGANLGVISASLLVRETNFVQVGQTAEKREEQARGAYGALEGAISMAFSRVLGNSAGVSGEDLGARGGSEVASGVVSGVGQPTVLLVDDVWTTGASMRAAKAALEASGVKRIICATICAGEGGENC